MIVFLVGYMGCGKTTIGRRLARRLGYDFADTDDRIEKQEGADVCDIFHYAGEEYFRKAEREMLEQLIASGDDLVVSTGGGLPVWADNMARMNGAGLTVYIRRSAEQIAARLSPHGRWKRPSASSCRTRMALARSSFHSGETLSLNHSCKRLM